MGAVNSNIQASFQEQMFDHQGCLTKTVIFFLLVILEYQPNPGVHMIHMCKIHDCITTALLLDCVQKTQHIGTVFSVLPKEAIYLQSLFCLVNSLKNQEDAMLRCTAPGGKNHRAIFTHKDSAESAVLGQFVSQPLTENSQRKFKMTLLKQRPAVEILLSRTLSSNSKGLHLLILKLFFTYGMSPLAS